MAGMCPNGDREGLDFYLAFFGQVESVDPSTGAVTTTTFKSLPPCTARDASGQCTSYATTPDYLEMMYRCTKCAAAPCKTTTTTTTKSTSTSTSSSSSPTTTHTKICSFGTAFGYEKPSGSIKKSLTLDTQPGQGCNRWGWYETPTLADLQGSGIGGPLYVGAGGNDIAKAVAVGAWLAKANSEGKVAVGWALVEGYNLAEANVHFDCLPLSKCAPGSYTCTSGPLTSRDTRYWAVTTLVYPRCPSGSRAALVVHASVNVKTTDKICPAPKAS
ncbi:uncharacterized protein B0I36DRAFT_336188 [Microdochium trichocladiopsis]|uniref:Uncharacterized protein n=1 Tax=Microdochium trichocladiopsis TaxID=1682393 RepID=A0A9P8XUW2_9PEZI|nr:uncharacterized protein B0I36DRAFT_336188 [Microdochium trichocladiopsis]KAH7018549.1 hypothetical protein B0I36DRAFT_336188 [Microdochium trichocladiopsis]